MVCNEYSLDQVFRYFLVKADTFIFLSSFWSIFKYYLVSNIILKVLVNKLDPSGPFHLFWAFFEFMIIDTAFVHIICFRYQRISKHRKNIFQLGLIFSNVILFFKPSLHFHVLIIYILLVNKVIYKCPHLYNKSKIQKWHGLFQDTWIKK